MGRNKREINLQVKEIYLNTFEHEPLRCIETLTYGLTNHFQSLNNGPAAKAYGQSEPNILDMLRLIVILIIII